MTSLTASDTAGARALAPAARDLGYLARALLTSVLAAVAWIAGLTVGLTASALIVGTPVLVGVAFVFRAVCDLGRRSAGRRAGRDLRGRYAAPATRGITARCRAVVSDPQTWRDLAWLLWHSTAGFALAVLGLSLAASVAGLATLPAWNWALPDGAQFGLWTADTLPVACASALLAIPLAAVTVGVLRASVAADVRVTEALLAA